MPGILEVNGKLGVRFTAVSKQGTFMVLFNGLLLLHTFDDLYDIQVDEVEADGSPVLVLASEIGQEPGYDGEDIYPPDEVDCPCCGAKFRLTMHARVERATPDEDEETAGGEGHQAPATSADDTWYIALKRGELADAADGLHRNICLCVLTSQTCSACTMCLMVTSRQRPPKAT